MASGLNQYWFLKTRVIRAVLLIAIAGAVAQGTIEAADGGLGRFWRLFGFDSTAKAPEECTNPLAAVEEVLGDPNLANTPLGRHAGLAQRARFLPEAAGYRESASATGDETTLYIQEFPGMIKLTRDRFSALQVNYLLKTMSWAITAALAKHGFGNGRSFLQDFKSTRLVISSGSLDPARLQVALEDAARRFEATVKSDPDRAWLWDELMKLGDEILKQQTPTAETATLRQYPLIVAAPGMTEHHACVAGRMGRKKAVDGDGMVKSRTVLSSYSEQESEIQEAYAKLKSLTSQLPSRVKAVQGFEAFLNGHQLSYSLFEVLRKAEHVSDLRKRLADIQRQGRSSDGLEPEVDSHELQNLAAGLWELKELIDIFTPPNEYEAGEVDTHFGDAQIEEQLGAIRNVRRLMVFDLRGAGARFMFEVYQHVASLPAEMKATEAINHLKTPQSLVWIRSRLESLISEIAKAEGHNRLTRWKTGDEIVMFLKGELDSSALLALRSRLPSDVRMVEVEALHPDLTQHLPAALREDVYSQLRELSEAAAKILEKQFDPNFGSNELITIRTRVRTSSESEGEILMEVYVMNAAFERYAAYNQFAMEDLTGRLSRGSLNRKLRDILDQGGVRVEVHFVSAEQASAVR